MPEIMQILRVCWGSDPFAFQTLNYPVSTAQNLTADSFHFGSEPQGFICGVWIVLEDIHPDSGPFEYFPGSHHLPYLQPKYVGSCQQESNTSDEIIFQDSWLSSLSRYRLGVKKSSPRVGQAVI